MRQEKEVRQHRDNLQRVIDAPCECRGLAAIVCQQHKRKIRVLIEHLDWCMGSCDLDRLVEEVAAVAARS